MPFSRRQGLHAPAAVAGFPGTREEACNQCCIPPPDGAQNAPGGAAFESLSDSSTEGRGALRFGRFAPAARCAFTKPVSGARPPAASWGRPAATARQRSPASISLRPRHRCAVRAARSDRQCTDVHDTFIHARHLRRPKYLRGPLRPIPQAHLAQAMASWSPGGRRSAHC